MLIQVVNTLSSYWQYDLNVMSGEGAWGMWMYYPMCIPAVFYIMFMLMKWAILTMPIWLPLHMAFGGKLVTLKYGKK